MFPKQLDDEAGASARENRDPVEVEFKSPRQPRRLDSHQVAGVINVGGI